MNGIKLLGATLLHFLWQGILIAVVYAAMRRCASRPAARYALACAALGAMAAAPVVTWITLRPILPENIAAVSSPMQQGPSAPAVFHGSLPRFFGQGIGASPSEWLSWVAAAWMFGVAVFCLRLVFAAMMAESLRRRQVRPAQCEWQQTFASLRARLRVPRQVRLLVSGLVQAPAVVGLLRPVVLVPVGALSGLPAEQMEALLLHELAHIRRYDYVVNVLQNVLEALLFYHPAVWWVSGHMRSERELCCDDLVVATTGDAAAYARALAEVGATGQEDYVAALGATGSPLVERVERLLGQRLPPSQASSPGTATAAAFVAVTSVGVWLLAAAFGYAQSETRLEFDAASLKPSAPGSQRRFSGCQGGPGTTDRTLFRCENTSLSGFVLMAYELGPFQLSAPGWMQSLTFDLQARIRRGTGKSEFSAMMRNLLAERFQLKAHSETRELSRQELIVANNGPKFTRAEEKPATEGTEAPTKRPNVGGKLFARDDRGRPILPTGWNGTAMTSDWAVMHQSAITMENLASTLSLYVGQLVVDSTGLEGKYEIELSWSNHMPGMLEASAAPDPPQRDFGPTIVQALQDQLGLRLRPKKGPVEVLVVDHAEKVPVAN